MEPNRAQPRRDFDEEALGELAASISEHGLIQPIAVRQMENGYYQIIAGERRWRASRLAGLKEVPVNIIEADDQTAAELTLIENLQREDLNPMEEARGYEALITSFGMSQEEAAKSVGKSRPAVANALRLLKLPKAIVLLVEDGSLSARPCQSADSPALRRIAKGSGSKNYGAAAVSPPDGGTDQTNAETADRAGA